MTVQKTDIHKKKSVSDGETVDKQTRGNLQFGVDEEGLARPFDKTRDGLGTNDFLLLILAKQILAEIKMIRQHLEHITEEDFNDND